MMRQKDQIALNNLCKKSLYIHCIVTIIEPTSNYVIITNIIHFCLFFHIFFFSLCRGGNSMTNGHTEKPKSIDDRMEPIEDDLCASVIKSSSKDLEIYCQSSMQHISQVTKIV